MKERFGSDLDSHKNEFVLIGDSPNDAPMFAYFQNSVGVWQARRFAKIGRVGRAQRAHGVPNGGHAALCPPYACCRDVGKASQSWSMR